MTNTILRTTACALVWSLGCAAAPDSASDITDTTDHDHTIDLAAASPHAAGLRITVQGTALLYGVTGAGIVSQPIDLSGYRFASNALSRGTWTREDGGPGRADGTFSVPVAAGATSWQLEEVAPGLWPYLAVGHARHPTLSHYVLGRLDGVQPSTRTDVSLEITGLAPWSAGDSTQIVVGNSGAIV